MMTTPATNNRMETNGSIAEPAHQAGTIGFFVVTGQRVSGWVWDPTRPELRLNVEVRCDGRTVASIKAEKLREDLRDVGMGDGRYGFALKLDEEIPGNESHRIEGVARERPGSPEILLVNRSGKCPPRGAPSHPGMPPWLAELTQLCREMEQVSKRLAQARIPTDSGKAGKETAELEGTLRQLEGRMSTIDTLQLSVDRLLAHSTDGSSPAAKVQAIAGLRWAVVAVGLLSLLSLVVGLRDIFPHFLFATPPS